MFDILIALTLLGAAVFVASCIHQKPRRKNMLVLSRRLDERLLIGDDIVITVVRIGPDAVRLGIDAPKGITILREELTRPPEPRPSLPDIRFGG